MKYENNIVTPDPRKGVLCIALIDGLIHVQWKDRLTGNEEQSIPILPEQATWRKVEKCTSGRVYVLMVDHSGDTPPSVYFYWMQEPSPDKDDDRCETVNRLLNIVSPALHNAMPYAYHDHWMHYLGYRDADDVRDLESSRRNVVELSTLQNILSGLDLHCNATTPTTEVTTVTVAPTAAVVPTTSNTALSSTSPQRARPMPATQPIVCAGQAKSTAAETAERRERSDNTP